MKEESEDLELNSGVEFPGESLEPILGAATSIGDDTLSDSSLIVEIADRGSPFAFKFRKN